MTDPQRYADRYTADPAAFIDDFIPLNEKGKPWRLAAYQRVVMAFAFTLALLRLLLFGEPKKSGKTLVLACLAARGKSLHESQSDAAWLATSI